MPYQRIIPNSEFGQESFIALAQGGIMVRQKKIGLKITSLCYKTFTVALNIVL
jgi:hypothetical protein